MLRQTITFLLIGLTSSCLHASNESLELRYGTFFHNCHKFKSIYGSKQSSYQVEFTSMVQHPYQVWANVDGCAVRAHVKECGTTRFSALNISFGVRALLPVIQGFDFYLGIGASAGCTSIKNHECAFTKKTNSLFPGGVLKSGFYCSLSDKIFIDLFVDYLYQPTTYHVDLGGIKVGVGLGARF